MPTATKAGVLIVPCGVVITPVRPSRPGSDATWGEAELPFGGFGAHAITRAEVVKARPAPFDRLGAHRRNVRAHGALPPQLESGESDDARRGCAQHAVADRYRVCAGSSQLVMLVGRDATLRSDDDQHRTGCGKINFGNGVVRFLVEHQGKVGARYPLGKQPVVTGSDTCGTLSRRDCLAASRTVDRHLFRDRTPRPSDQRTIDRDACQGTISADAHLGQHLDCQLRPVAFRQRLHRNEASRLGRRRDVVRDLDDHV